MSEESQLTLFAEDTPASLSVQPGGVEARKMTATSGRKCADLLRKSDRLGSLLKTLLVTLPWGSTKCLLTWRPLVTPSRRLLFRLVPLTPDTGETGSGLW